MHTTWGRFVCKPSKVHKWFRERKLVKAWPFCFPKALWSTAFLFLLQCLNLFLTPLQRVDSWHAIIFCTPSCSSHFSAQLNARQASGLASCSCSQTYRILGQLAWATQNFIEHFYALVLWPTTLSSIINYTFDLIMFFFSFLCFPHDDWRSTGCWNQKLANLFLAGHGLGIDLKVLFINPCVQHKYITPVYTITQLIRIKPYCNLWLVHKYNITRFC